MRTLFNVSGFAPMVLAAVLLTACSGTGDGNIGADGVITSSEEGGIIDRRQSSTNRLSFGEMQRKRLADRQRDEDKAWPLGYNRSGTAHVFRTSKFALTLSSPISYYGWTVPSVVEIHLRGYQASAGDLCFTPDGNFGIEKEMLPVEMQAAIPGALRGLFQGALELPFSRDDWVNRTGVTRQFEMTIMPVYPFAVKGHKYTFSDMEDVQGVLDIDHGVLNGIVDPLREGKLYSRIRVGKFFEAGHSLPVGVDSHPLTKRDYGCVGFIDINPAIKDQVLGLMTYNARVDFGSLDRWVY